MSEPPATDAFHSSDETYRVLFEMESDAIFLIDNEAGQILEANPAASALYGYSRAELLAKRNVDLSAEPDDTRAATQAQRLWVPVRYHRKQDGTVFPVEITARHFVWRGREAHIAAIRDITDRQRAHEALARRTRQLETVRSITAEITRELDLTALLRLIARRVAELVDASHSVVFLWDEGAGALRPHAWYGYGPDDEAWLAGLALRPGEGVAGTVAERRTGLIVNDYRTSPHGHPAVLARTAIATALAEPLLYRERLVGVFLVDRTAPECPFTETDRVPIALLATQAAIAIENARLHQAALQRGTELEAVLRATRSVMSGLDLQAILDRIVAETARISRCSHVKVLLVERDAEVLRVGAIQGTAMSDGDRLPVGVGHSGIVARTGELLYVADAPNDPNNAYATRDRELGIVTFLGLPIKSRGEVLGVLSFNTTVPRQYGAEELAYLQAFADQVAIAIENARLFQAEQGRRKEVEAVQAVNEELVRELDLTTLLRLIHAHALALVGGDSGVVWLWDEAAQVVTPHHWTGFGTWLADVRVRPGEGVAGTVAARREGMFVNAFRTSPYATPFWLERSPHVAALAEPLLYGERLVGVITVSRNDPAQPFRAEHQRRLKLFAAPAAIAIENARLYASARTHAAALELALADLRELDRLKSQFLANVSHELRSPLTPILGYLPALLSEDFGPLTPPQRTVLDNMATSVDRLHQLIEDLLMFVERETGQRSPHRAAVAVAALIETGGARALACAREKGVRVVTEVPADLPPIWAHVDALSRALGHVLENAVKFTPPRGTVTVAARRSGALRDASPDVRSGHAEAPPSAPQASGEHVEVTVQDDGIGIPPEALPRIFDRFYQVDGSSTREYGGTGLGLALTRRLVEQHGGTISATSPGEGQGSTFTVRLPFAGPPRPAEAG